MYILWQHRIRLKTILIVIFIISEDMIRIFLKYFMASKIIDKNTNAFEDIKFTVKRLAPSPSFINTLESPNVVLLYHDNPITESI